MLGDAFRYQFGLWLGTLTRLLWLPGFLRAGGRRRLFYAHEVLAGALDPVDLETVVGHAVDDAVAVSARALPASAVNCTLFEHFTLATIARLVEPAVSIDIGTYDGRSALAIAANVPDGSIVYSLNLPPDYLGAHSDQSQSVDVRLSTAVESGYRWRGLPEARKIRQLYGNSRDFDFAPYVPAQLVMIDGGHDFATALSDSRMALSAIDRRNGAILWDDALLYGVPRALKLLIGEGYPIRLVFGTGMALLRFKDGAAVVY